MRRTHPVASVGFLALLAAGACGRPAEDRDAPPAHQTERAEGAPRREIRPHVVAVEEGMLRDLRVTVGLVETRPGGERVVLLGELAVDQRAYAEISAPAPARVTRLLAGAGDRVRAGQTLAELTSPELGKLRAEYLSARARVELADAALERKQGLAAERIVPPREVQEAESAAAEARAALRAAHAGIGGYGVEPPAGNGDGATSSSFALRSPVSGSVIDRAAVLGQMLDPATPAFRIGDLASLWLTVHASERDAVRIRRGVPARLSFPALPARDFQGTVTMVGRLVDPESRTVPVRIDVRNTGDLLRPGMTATAAVPVGETGEPILSVPVAAVQRVRNDWCVFIPKTPSTFEIRRIGRGRDLGPEVEVLSGLRAGETIVIDGAFLLKAQAEQGEADHGH